jgi:heat shock protein HspQ
MDPQEKVPAPKFSIGEVVRHRRYGYRGVIFGWDPVCTASEDWYQGNQTQPDRNQPWYRVLVDGHTHTTYVAQSNLQPDPSESPVMHPWLDRIFSSRRDGRYVRRNMN